MELKFTFGTHSFTFSFLKYLTMMFFKPYLRLIRRSNVGQNDSFFLNVTTFCDQVIVYLNIVQDEQWPVNPGIYPINHYIDLGQLEMDEGGSIQVNLYKEDNNGDQPTATATVRAVDSEDEARPIVAGTF